MTRPNRRPPIPAPVPRMRPGVPAAPKPPVPLNPAIRSALRGQLTEATLDRLTQDMASAAATLGFLSRQSKSESVRLNAARALIELAARMREQTELEERIKALEEDRA